LIYGLTDTFMAPFRTLLPTVGTGSSSRAVLETPVVIAIIVYALIGWVLARLIVIMFFRNTPGAIGGPQLWTIDLTGYGEVRVPTPAFASDPAWSPLLN